MNLCVQVTRNLRMKGKLFLARAGEQKVIAIVVDDEDTKFSNIP